MPDRLSPHDTLTISVNNSRPIITIHPDLTNIIDQLCQTIGYACIHAILIKYPVSLEPVRQVIPV